MGGPYSPVAGHTGSGGSGISVAWGFTVGAEGRTVAGVPGVDGAVLVVAALDDALSEVVEGESIVLTAAERTGAALAFADERVDAVVDVADADDGTGGAAEFAALGAADWHDDTSDVDAITRRLRARVVRVMFVFGEGGHPSYDDSSTTTTVANVPYVVERTSEPPRGYSGIRDAWQALVPRP